MGSGTMRVFFSLILTVACLVIGYGYYRMNHGDWFNAVFFALGLMGISLSVLRNSTNNKNDL